MKKYLKAISFSVLGFLLPLFTKAANIPLTNPLGSIKTPQALIGNIIQAIMGLVGSIALLMFIYGGIIWLTSSGKPESIKKGKDVFVWSAIGMIVIFLSYALVRVIISILEKGS